MFKSLRKFIQPTQSSHIVRRGRVGKLAAPRARIPAAHRLAPTVNRQPALREPRRAPRTRESA
eukprot:14013-Pyramimonas_sp.AAC.1